MVQISKEVSLAETEKVWSPEPYSSVLAPEQHCLHMQIFALNKMFMLPI